MIDQFLLLSLPVGIWTFVVLCSCVGSQVAREVQLGRNALQTGNPQAAVGYLRNAAVLDTNYKTPYSIRESVWTYLGRAYYEVGKRYGVGFAQVQKDYGTGADAAVTTLSLDAAGRLSMRQHGNDMGTGMTTSQAVMVAKVIGRVPDHCTFGVTEWPEMPLFSGEEPYTMSQAEQDRLAANPRWTPSFASPMSASNSAYFVGHATRTAAATLSLITRRTTRRTC